MRLTFLENYFSIYPNTMSIHLRAGCFPLAKHGTPGSYELSTIAEQKLLKSDIETFVDLLLTDDSIEDENEWYLDDSLEDAYIIQIDNYRIVVTFPPFSDALELTAVRPTLKRSLSEYNLQEALTKRLSSRAEGILIAGSPGAGKSTFAAGLAEFYAEKKKIVKTLEHPRDLQVSDSITQYTKVESSMKETAELLLLLRPDYVIYDELRNTDDFKTYSDMRLAGIGLVGVVHATKGIDAIQRFIGRVDVGIIPSLIDTIVFIKDGEVDQCLSLKMSVKTPTGFADSDLARPVVEVFDFLLEIPLYEIYSFGEQIVVIPVSEETGRRSKRNKKTVISHKKIDRLYKDVMNLASTDKIDIQITGRRQVAIYVPSRSIPYLIGTSGKTIRSLEQSHGLKIKVHPLDEIIESNESGYLEIDETKKHLILRPSNTTKNASIQVNIDGEHFIILTTNSDGEIKLNKSTRIATELKQAINNNKMISYSSPNI